MIVDPDFFDHWRTRMVVDLLDGDQLAPLYIMRLWAHCQNRKSDVFDIPSLGIKSLCQYQGCHEQLERALVAAEYLQRDGKTVTVVGWAEKNASLIASWSNGHRGGRPRKNPEETREKPTGNPQVTHGQPSENPAKTQTKPIREEKRREEKKEPIGSSLAAKRRNRLPADFVPNQTGIDIAEQRGIDLHEELQKFTDYHTAKGSVMVDWQAAFRTWLNNAASYSRTRPLANKQVAIESRNRAVGDEWIRSQGVVA